MSIKTQRWNSAPVSKSWGSDSKNTKKMSQEEKELRNIYLFGTLGMSKRADELRKEIQSQRNINLSPKEYENLAKQVKEMQETMQKEKRTGRWLMC